LAVDAHLLAADVELERSTSRESALLRKVVMRSHEQGGTNVVSDRSNCRYPTII
jgi:hypothetical protein